MNKVIEKIKDIMIYFICFSFIGWIYEVALFLIEDHIFVNRGYLFGPWLPVYGFGGFIIYSLFNKLKNKPVKIKKINIRPLLIFIYITVIAASVELLTTYIFDLLKSDWTKLWFYGDRFMNLQGRIAFFPSIKFGIVGVVVIYLVVPLIDKFKSINKKPALIITYSIFALFIIDVIIHIFTGSTYTGPV